MFRLLAASLVLLSFVFGGDPAPGSELDDLWFKVKVKAKGWAFAGGLAEPEKASFSTTVYAHFALQGGMPPSYTLSIWSELAPDVWSPQDIDFEEYEVGTGGGVWIFSSIDATAQRDDGSSINCVAVVALQASKTDETGKVVKARFTSLGMEVDAGTLADGTQFRGGGTLRGSTVDVEDLPFTPS